MHFLLSSFIGAGVLTIAATAAVFFYPGLLVLPRASTLKSSPYCGLWQGIRDNNVKLERFDLSRKIQDTSRVVRMKEISNSGPPRWGNTGFRIPTT